MNFRIIKVVSIIILSTVLFGCKTSNKVISETPPEKTNEPVTEVEIEKKSIFQKLQENKHLNAKETIALYHKLKKESPNEYNFENERELNRYGYELLGADKIKSAIEIFKLLVSEFPDSANPYDSLGEAYKIDGNKELALINYEKSLDINPKNNHAIDQVTKLKGLELLVTDWGKEFFHFPLHFAEEIPYQGVEEVVFPANWIKADSSDFWSYVFVWALDNKQSITAQELETNLKFYFDGLIGGLSRTDKSKLTEATTSIQENTDPNDSVTFTGKLNIFDGFVTQKPLTLNARIYSTYCNKRDKLLLLFRLSPLEYDHPIWDKLRTVEVRSTVCNE